MGTILTEPVTGRVAWHPQDLERDESWKLQLSERALREIDAALRNVQSRKIALHAIQRGDFPLETLAEDLASIAEELEHGRGLKLIRGLPIERYDEHELETIYWGIGTHLGLAVSQNPQGELLGHVRDQGKTLSDLRVRGYQTHESTGLHVDNCDVVGLLCLRTAVSGGVSQVVSSIAIYNELLRRFPWYVGVLNEPFAIDMRGQERPGDSPVWYRPIYSYYDGQLSCGVNFLYCRTAMEKLGQTMSAARLEALEIMERIAYELCFEMEFQPGDMQFLNNYVILHDRTTYVDHAEPEKKRHLLRLWLSVPNGRHLAPDFRSAYAATLRTYETTPRA